ncbi:MAG: transcription termination/antitermination NusG family protein [Bacteroidota bacterium]
MKQSQWHIVYTRPERENKVAELLNKKGFKAYCPQNRLHATYGSKKKITGFPLFASYVFVSIREDQKSSVLHTNGVMGFVYWLDKPVVIRDEEVAAINFFLQDYPQVMLEKIAVNVNEPVRVINEPVMVRKGNFMEVSNPDSKVMLPSLGYVMIADTRKQGSETFIYKEESRVKV